MTNPLDSQFWQNEEALLYGAMSQPALDSFMMGVAGGVTALPEMLRPFADYDHINRAALEYLETFRLVEVGRITDTTRRQVQTAIADWIKAGDPLPRLIEKLTPIFGPVRAETIAVTNVTQIFAAGNVAAWQSTGFISGKKWQTAVDDKVCLVCRPLHGQVVQLDQTFTLDMNTVAGSPAMKQLLGDKFNEQNAIAKAMQTLQSYVPVQYPPAHSRCRCWLLPFVSEVDFEQQVGGILAQEFFALVRSGAITGVAI